MQLAEMDRASKEDAGTSTPGSSSKAKSSSNGDVSGTALKSTDSLATGIVIEEDEKERTIAKAALSIAELSTFGGSLLHYSLINRAP